MKLFGSLLGCLFISLGLLLLILEMLGLFGYFEATIFLGIEIHSISSYLILFFGTMIFFVLGIFMFYVSYIMGTDITENIDISRIAFLFLSSIFLLSLLFMVWFLLINVFHWSDWKINGKRITGEDWNIYYMTTAGISLIGFLSFLYLGYFRARGYNEMTSMMVPAETLEMITNLAIRSGMSDEQLRKYCETRYNKPLNYLGIKEVEDLISELKVRTETKHKSRFHGKRASSDSGKKGSDQEIIIE